MDDDWDPFDAGVEGSIFQSMWPTHRGMPSISKMMDAAERAGEAHVARTRNMPEPERLDDHWDEELWDDATLEAQGAVPPNFQRRQPRAPQQQPPRPPPQPQRQSRTPAPPPDDDTPDWLKGR